MDLREIRIRRLELFAQRHGAEDNPSKLGELIGKKPNQVYNLLHRQSSFGEKVARSIEEAAGLPRYWLDTDESQATVNTLSPEVAEVAGTVDRLPVRQRDWVLKTVREAIDLARETIQTNNGAPKSKTVTESGAVASAKRRKSA